ncbi:hypothetical protein KJ682_18095 [bacterium]|nr:hypothetical protein [bacterium]
MIRKLIIFLSLLAVLAGLAACSDTDRGLLAPTAGKAVLDGDAALKPMVADPAIVAGPFHFQRTEPGRSGAMRPRFEEAAFALEDPAGWAPEFVLRLHSGPDVKGTISSAVVLLNGEQIFGPGDFNGSPVDLAATVALQEQNSLSVKIAGSPGSACAIVIEGTPLGELHARALYPLLSNTGPKRIPLTLRVSCEGWIGDDHADLPAEFRTLMVPAVWDGVPLMSRTDFQAHVADIVTDGHPEWSDWESYAPTIEERSRLYSDLDTGEFYLFAVQVRDAAGRVSTGLGYQIEVLHLLASENYFRPTLTVFENNLGPINVGQTLQVAPGQELAFSWSATAQEYNGFIVAYRHGWDLIDPSDPSDPGWAVEPGLAPENLAAAPVAFAAGTHELTIRVVDDFGQVRVGQVVVAVVPAAEPLRDLPDRR